MKRIPHGRITADNPRKRPKPRDNSVWAWGAWLTKANLALHRELWLSGMTTANIARTIGMGCTPNAVIGRAHRDDLPPRPSPLNRGKKAPPAMAQPRKPPQSHNKAGVKKPSPVIEPPPPVIVPMVRPSPPPARTCQFITGDVKSKNFYFCDAPTCKNKDGHDTSWCLHHLAIVFVHRSWHHY